MRGVRHVHRYTRTALRFLRAFIRSLYPPERHRHPQGIHTLTAPPLFTLCSKLQQRQVHTRRCFYPGALPFNALTHRRCTNASYQSTLCVLTPPCSRKNFRTSFETASGFSTGNTEIIEIFVKTINVLSGKKMLFNPFSYVSTFQSLS